MSKLRNFSIIAHIDHGKSTLADRLLEHTGTVAKREMRAQLLDQMDLERERGITIKLQPVTMEWQGHTLNLIDTPGHVDFSYEVSRSLQACEGAVLLVDASQGVEAQTLANVQLAMNQGLVIIPVINKIDLPSADVDRVSQEIEDLIALPKEDIVLTSGKTGDGVPELLEAIINRIPAPSGNAAGPLRALIFDSAFDSYRGVVTYLRVVDGRVGQGNRLRLMASSRETEAMETGVLKPDFQPQAMLETGAVGYVVTGLKEVSQARVGDTVTLADRPAVKSLPGYQEVQPVLYAGIYAGEGEDVSKLREALGKLALNDASLQYEPERSSSLGVGFRCGFLGLLHLDIVRERLEREYELDLFITAPSVNYRIILHDGTEMDVHTPTQLPDPSAIAEFQEPWTAVEIMAPAERIGSIIPLITERRGVHGDIGYLEKTRVIIKAELPLSHLITDFYDVLKSATSGYASLSYELNGYRSGPMVKLDILVAGEPVESLATIVHKDEAYQTGQRVLLKLKDLLPKAQFAIALQAAIGGKVIARETISALRKDVTAKLYGGDVTRKRKLLEKQKKGKKKLKQVGGVSIPSDAFLALLKR